MFPGPFRNRKKFPFPFMGESFLDGFFNGVRDDILGTIPGRFGSTDIYEKDGSLHYEIDLPGWEKEDITIQVNGNRLMIIGEVSQDKDEQGVNYFSRGRRYGKFQRSLPLPEEVENPNELKAKFENGVLHIEARLSRSITEDETFNVEIE